MEMGFPFFFFLLFLSIYFAIFFSNLVGEGREKRKGNKENNTLAARRHKREAKWKTVILIDAILMAKRWGNLKLFDSLCWFNSVAIAIAIAKWEIRSVYARFKASLITIWAAEWESKKRKTHIASYRQRQSEMKDGTQWGTVGGQNFQTNIFHHFAGKYFWKFPEMNNSLYTYKIP